MKAFFMAAIVAAQLVVPTASAQVKPTVSEVGKYRVELRLPEEGLYAGEEVDVEFRIGDKSQDDPIQGLAGVANAATSARVRMPSMAGMPEMTPKTHREGVPGDYGVELFFPHGGTYELALSIHPPEAPPFQVTFEIDVKDERPSKTNRPKPYKLEVSPGTLAAGKATVWKLAVKESKGGRLVKDFDVAHEQQFHLLIASSDFVWFAHEHPEQQRDGTWQVSLTLPYAGSYLVYGDVAPKGKGSMILHSAVKASGTPPPWRVTWQPNLGPSADQDVTGTLSHDSEGIPLGRSTEIAIRIRDSQTNLPVENLQPWLGAMGHLMIFSQDGSTAVHSHPQETPEALALSAKGEVRFNARFPMPGPYRAFAQFKRNGQIRTLSFTLEVKK